MEIMKLDLILTLENTEKKIALSSGARLALVGPSGCGKSTFVKCLVGVSDRAKGEFFLNGQDLMRLHSWDRGIGYVPQDLILLPHLTIKENLLFPKLAKEDHSVYQGLGIDHLMGRMPRNLSGGEKQRVALARALTSQSKLLILDEPFSSLDKGNKERAVRFVDDFCTTHQLPIIFISHEDQEIEQLKCERYSF